MLCYVLCLLLCVDVGCEIMKVLNGQIHMVVTKCIRCVVPFFFRLALFVDSKTATTEFIIKNRCLHMCSFPFNIEN